MSENSQISGKRGGKRSSSFKPGQTGNPGGRPKKTQEELDLVEACKGKTPAALAVIEKIMTSGSNERNQLSAALAIIERAWGKAIQPQTLSGPNGGEIPVGIRVSFK
ncbi:MAG: hypothetical protein IPN69_08580 [Acidobacteria bacterium]|nr:hypothetical protein [Acidobacteriota bacterium]